MTHTPQVDFDLKMDRDGHTIRLTHPDKVLYPEAGVTKREIAEYYLAVAPTMIPHLVGRPATRKRWPDGVDAAAFFAKDLPGEVPKWLDTRVRHQSRRDVRYPVLDSAAGLVWCAQLAALELHVPQWQFDPESDAEDAPALPPDRLVFDLDPGPGAGLAECATIARAIREAMGEFGDGLVPVTSGSKGLHLYLGLNGSMSSAEASEWAHALARSIEKDRPREVVSRMTKSARAGKVLIDWSQNNAEKTTVAPYSLRGRAQPMVAAPRLWEELESGELTHLDFREALRRIDEIGDPMAELGANAVAAWTRGSSGPRDDAPRDGVPGRGDSRAGEGGNDDAADDPADDDALATYRAKRHADRTPEPVPSAPVRGAAASDKARGRPAAGQRITPSNAAKTEQDGPSFVIQEHHARRLHWDFRLEHRGVLVSWAVPKGLPERTGVRRLAVQTEDHPLEYGTFAGTIPRGEYGAGDVTIWDAGTYRLEKWRDDEVIAVLDGERVRGRYVLVRTGGDQWLLQRSTHQPGINVPAEREKSMPRGLSPMLATLGESDDIGAVGWQYEGKWDGVRAIVEVADGVVTAHGRSGASFTATYPEVSELADALAGHRAVLDGEIVALGPAGAPDFGLLQQRIGLTRRQDVDPARRRVPAHLYAFDLLYLDGVSLTGKTLSDRRRLLERLGVDTPSCHVPELIGTDAIAALEAARRRRLEGVVAKRLDSSYRPGARPGTWVKVKFRATQDVVIVGWRPGTGRRAGGIGSLLLGTPRDGTLVYAGRVGTGFRDVDLEMLRRKLTPLERKTSPVADSVPSADARDAVWVRPALVGEVEFAQWTDSGRLRQPSWRGLRPGLSPADVRIES